MSADLRRVKPLGMLGLRWGTATAVVLVGACQAETGPARPEVGVSSNQLEVEQPCILGTSLVTIGRGSWVSGDVRSNGTVELQAGGWNDHTTVQGSIAGNALVQLNGFTDTTGDVGSNQLIEMQYEADVEGETTAPEIHTYTGHVIYGESANLQEVTIPPQTFEVGTVPVSISGATCDAAALTPGQYAALTVDSNCTLKLQAGTYSFTRFDAYVNARVAIESGPVQVMVEGAFNFGDGATVLDGSGPNDLLVYSEGDIRLGADAAFTGRLTTPNGTATVARTNNGFHGCVAADRVYFEPEVLHEGVEGTPDVGSLTRLPVTLDGTAADTKPNEEEWYLAERYPDAPTGVAIDDPDCVGATRLLLSSGAPVRVAACNVHFPHCDYDGSNPDPTVDDCLDGTGALTDPSYAGYYNLYLTLEELNRADFGRQFELDQTGFAHKPSNDSSGGLYEPPDGSVDIQVEMVTNAPGSTAPFGATGATALFVESTSATLCERRSYADGQWHGSAGGVGVEYGILYLNLSNFYPPAGHKPPGIGIFAHEMGHLLGMVEQRDRRYPIADFFASTGQLELWDAEDPARGVVTAYTDWLLDHTYGDKIASHHNPWRMHDHVQQRDAGTLDDHSDVSGGVLFQSYNPRHLRWDSSAGHYVDCHTGRVPHYLMQFSEVGAASSEVAEAHWTVADGSGAIHQTVSMPLAGVGAVSDWAQWEWEEPLVITTDITSGGASQLLTIEARISTTQATTHPDDNSISMSARLYPAWTTDPACVPKAMADGSPAELGASLARDPNSPIVAVGAPALDDGLTVDLGGVMLYQLRDEHNPSEIDYQETVAAPAGMEGSRVGASVAYRADPGGPDVLVAGAPAYDDLGLTDLGAVVVFVGEPANWTANVLLPPADPDGAGPGEGGRNDDAQYGHSVAIVGDQLLVGAPGTVSQAVGTATGMVWAYTIDPGTNPSGWPVTQLAATSSSPLDDAEYGFALAADGNTLVVGAPGWNGFGSAYVFDWDGPAAAWTQQVELEAARPAPVTGVAPGDPASYGTLADHEAPLPNDTKAQMAGDRFGAAVSIGADLIVVGAPDHDYDAEGDVYVRDAGAAFVYARGQRLRNGNGHWFWTGKLTATGTEHRDAWDHFGTSVSVTPRDHDGPPTRSILVGAPYHDWDASGSTGSHVENAGAVFVFDLVEHGDFVFAQKWDALQALGTRGAGDHFGAALLSWPQSGELRRDHWMRGIVGAPNASTAVMFAWGNIPGTTCTVDADCNGGVCVEGICGPATIPPTTCTEDSADDMGSDGQATIVPNDGCVRVRDAYPDWWDIRPMKLQAGENGTYPIPFTWSNPCTGSGGSDVLTHEWQELFLTTTGETCATLIDLQGAGDGNVTLRYYSN